MDEIQIAVARYLLDHMAKDRFCTPLPKAHTISLATIAQYLRIDIKDAHSAVLLLGDKGALTTTRSGYRILVRVDRKPINIAKLKVIADGGI